MKQERISSRSDEVEETVGALNAVMRFHAGGIEAEQSGSKVSIRFTGACAFCYLRPVTLKSIIEPALLAVDGVDAVEGEGVRVSAAADRRIAEMTLSQGEHPLVAVVSAAGRCISGA
jgi:Fe-S cluster biogenesis protein NfuA